MEHARGINAAVHCTLFCAKAIMGSQRYCLESLTSYCYGIVLEDRTESETMVLTVGK
jgi:hypothetical protein